MSLATRLHNAIDAVLATEELSYDEGPVTFMREAWGPEHGRGSRLDDPVPLVVVHHFATPHVPAGVTLERERSTMRGVERHHAVTRGWLGIGYNWIVFQSGHVYEGRGWGRQGAHTRGQNHRSVGIAFAIDADQRPPSEAALEGCRALIRRGVRFGHIAPGFAVQGHRDFAETSCPGRTLYPLLDSLR